MSTDNMAVFTGNANPALAELVVRHLGIPLGKATVGRFSDGEVMVEIMEHVRGKDIFILQPTCAPSNDNLMELLVMIDAARRSSARRITAVIPYYGYARQDRRPRTARVAITAKLVAEMITAAGANRVLTVDLHADQIQGFFDIPTDNIYADQIQGFFDIPTDNIYASPILLGDLWRQEHGELLVVSPDVGGVVRARAMAKHLEADLAIIDKRRPRPNEAKVMNIIGEVGDRICVLMDDLVDTAGTLCEAAAALKNEGARKVLAYCTHPVLSGQAIERIEKSQLDELVVTNTIPLRPEAQACKRIRQLSIAELLAESIRRIADDDSISTLFME